MNEFWEKTLFKLGEFTLSPAKLVAVLLIFAVAWVLVAVIRRILLGRPSLTVAEAGTRSSVFQLARYLIYVVAISASVSALGFDITLLIAGSAALLVGIGFGLQNIFSDLVSGLFMLFEQKVKVGDVMEVDNIVGRVEKISLRTSVLLTRDGYNIIVPNNKFITENVINWTHQGFQRRFQLEVGVSYESDVEKVSELLLKCAWEQQEILHDDTHEPFIRFQDFGDSALVFYLMFWTADIFRVEQVKSYLRFRILRSFRENNISIPYPQRDIHIIQS